VRTTLTIDDDVLAGAKALAAHQKRTLGQVVSDLARRSLVSSMVRVERNGVPLLPITNLEARVTLEMVNELRDGR